jgi:hypothetical protein
MKNELLNWQLGLLSPILFMLQVVGLLNPKMAQLFMNMSHKVFTLLWVGQHIFILLSTFIWKNYLPIWTFWSYSPPILKLAKPSRLNPSLGKLDSFIAMVLPPLFMSQPFPSCYGVALAFNYNNNYSCFVTHKLTSQNNEEVKSAPPDWFVI